MRHPTAPGPPPGSHGPPPAAPGHGPPTGPPRHQSWWRAKLERTPLGTRMVAAAMAMVVLALLLIGGASVMYMRTYLTSRVDDQLKSLAGQAEAQINQQIRAGNREQITVSLGRLIPVSGTTTVHLNKLNYVFEVRDAHGRLVRDANTNKLQQLTFSGDRATVYPSYSATPTDLGNADRHPFTAGSNTGDERWRVLVHRIELRQGYSYLVISGSLDSVDTTVNRLIRIELLVGFALLVLLAAVGAAIVTVSLRPLRDIERTAGAIAAGNLGLRVPERDPHTELGRLGRALNAMLGQIEAAFAAQTHSEYVARRSADSARRAADAARSSADAAHRSEGKMRRFIADASHELRTPLTTIRGFAELYRQRAGGRPTSDEPAVDATAAPPSDTQDVLHAPDSSAADTSDAERLMGRIEAEAARMGLLVEDLLMLARLDQQRPIAHEPVDLLAVAADTVQNARAVTPDREITLAVDAGSGPPPVVLGDEPRVRQVLRNLMDNAIAHTPAATPVQVAVRTEAGTAVVEVTDRGPGLTAEQRERVFERFYRVDKARSREAGGTGLGLAIVASLVAAHRGTVEVDSEPGAGATFRVRLPLAPSDTDPGDDPGHSTDDPDDPGDAGTPDDGPDEPAPGN